MGLKLSEDQEKELVNHFCQMIQSALDDRIALDTKLLPEYWKRYEGDWSSKTDKDFPFKGAADINVPFITWATDAIDSRQYASIFSAGQICKIQGSTKESRNAAPRVTNFVNHYLKNVMKVAKPYSSWFLGSVVEGQRALKTVAEKTIKEKMHFKTAKSENGIMKMLTGLTADLKSVFIKETKRTERTKVVSTDVATKDLIWPSFAISIQSSPWVAERLYLTKYDMGKRVATQGYIKKNINALKSPDGKNMKADQTTFQEKKEGLDSDSAKQLIDVYAPYEIWGRYKFDEKEGEQDCVFVIDMKNKVLLAADYNTNRDKRKPYTMKYHRYIPQRMIGQGMPRRLALMNDEMNTLHNIVIDNSTLCNTFNFLYVEGKNAYFENWKLKPGNGIAVDSLEGDIKQFPLGNPNLNLHQQENFVLSLLERLSLIGDYSLGRESSQTSRPTARGTSMILHEMSMNFGKIAANTQQAVGEHIKQVLEILYEILPEETSYYPNPDDDNEIVFSRTDLEYIDDFEIIVLGEAISASKQLQVNNAASIMEFLGQDQTGEVNTSEVKKNFVNQVDRNITRDIIRPPKELQQLQQAQQMIQQKAQMLRQKEMELEEKEMIISLKEKGATDEEIKEEVIKWRTQVMQEESQERNSQPQAPA